jgi:hypothetical protein
MRAEALAQLTGRLIGHGGQLGFQGFGERGPGSVGEMWKVRATPGVHPTDIE